MSTTELTPPPLVLICTKEGEPHDLQLGQRIDVQAETATSWEIEMGGEHYLVSKQTNQIRGYYNSVWLHLAPPPVVAWRAADDDHAIILFSPHAPNAEQIGEATYYEVQLGRKNAHVERAPELDQYAEEGQVPPQTLLDKGYWIPCQYCGCRLPRDPAVRPGPIVIEGFKAWCDAKCRGQVAANRAARKADELAITLEYSKELVDRFATATFTGAPNEIAHARAIFTLASRTVNAYRQAAILNFMPVIVGDDLDYELENSTFVNADDGEGKPGDVWCCITNHEWLCRVDDAGEVTIVEYRYFGKGKSLEAATKAAAQQGGKPCCTG